MALDAVDTMTDEHLCDSQSLTAQIPKSGGEEGEPQRKASDTPEPHSSAKQRALNTVCCYSTFLLLGCLNTVLGASLVDVEVLLGVDTRTVSITFLTFNGGYMLGCVILGFLYHRFDATLQLGVALAVSGVALAVAPSGGSLPGFASCMAVMGVGLGYIDSIGHPYILRLWQHHRWRNPVMHIQNSMFNVGSFLTPLILQPFLLPDTPEDHSVASHNVSNLTHGCNRTSASMCDQRVSNIHFGYLTLAGFTALPVVLCFMTSALHAKQNCLKATKPGKTSNKSNSREKNSGRVLILTLSVLLFFYQITESTSGSLLATYVIKGMQWTTHRGALLLSAMHGVGFAGHVISIPVSYWLTPSQMLIISLVLITSAFSVLLLNVFILIPHVFIWLSVGGAGVGFSAFFGNVLLWSATYMDVDGVASSVFLTSVSLAGMLGPFITGVLFPLLGPHIFVYVIFGCTFVVISLFIFVTYFVRLADIPRITKVKTSKELTKLQCPEGNERI